MLVADTANIKSQNDYGIFDAKIDYEAEYFTEKTLACRTFYPELSGSYHAVLKDYRQHPSMFRFMAAYIFLRTALEIPASFA